MAAAMRGAANGAISVPAGLRAGAALHTGVRMSANTALHAALRSVLASSASGGKDTPAGLAFSGALAGDIWGSKDLPETGRYTDSLAAAAEGAKNIPSALLASEVLTALSEATRQTSETTTVRLTIPPGGELRLDSELFLALLDGENVLYAQAGDWINVSRDLLRLVVESATGGALQGQLIYTERFL